MEAIQMFLRDGNKELERKDVFTIKIIKLEENRNIAELKAFEYQRADGQYVYEGKFVSRETIVKDLMENYHKYIICDESSYYYYRYPKITVEEINL